MVLAAELRKLENDKKSKNLIYFIKLLWNFSRRSKTIDRRTSQTCWF